MPQLSNSTIKEQRDAAFRFRGQAITYRQRNDSVNLQTGTATESNTDTEIGSSSDTDADPGVLTNAVSDRQIANSGGRYQAGDRWFRVRHDDLPETPPKTTNEIIFNSETYRIIMHKRSGDGYVWDILGRKS